MAHGFSATRGETCPGPASGMLVHCVPEPGWRPEEFLDAEVTLCPLQEAYLTAVPFLQVVSQYRTHVETLDGLHSATKVRIRCSRIVKGKFGRSSDQA